MTINEKFKSYVAKFFWNIDFYSIKIFEHDISLMNEFFFFFWNKVNARYVMCCRIWQSIYFLI